MPERSLNGKHMLSGKTTYNISGEILRKDWQVAQHRYMRRIFCIPSIQEVISPSSVNNHGNFLHWIEKISMPNHEYVDRWKNQLKVHGTQPVKTAAPPVKPREGFRLGIRKHATSETNLSTAICTNQPQRLSGSIIRTSFGNRGTLLDSTTARRL